MMRSAARLLIALASLALGPVSALAADGHGGGHAKHEDAHAPAADQTTEAAEGEAAPPPVPLWPETPAVDKDRQPYVVIRALRAVQDEIAAGNAAAQQQQRKRLQQVTEHLRDLPVAVWDDVRNLRAAIYLVLSGGDPAILKVVMGREKSPHLERRLVRGALAYGEGRMVDALSLLVKVDARKVDPMLAGIVSLIQGTLVAKKDPLKALRYFDDARLLSPGTLVEEAALRQQILTLARDGQIERYDLLADQYSRRFAKSIFARTFRRQFLAGVARRSFKGGAEWGPRTETELAKAPPSERPGLYLAIADEALKVGNVDIARHAGGKARELAPAGSRTQERAKVFEGAALAVSPDFEKGLQLLAEVDVAKVTATDRQIREAAIEVARNVGRWPGLGPKPDELPALGSVDRAQAMLRDIDTLLGGASR